MLGLWGGGRMATEELYYHKVSDEVYADLQRMADTKQVSVDEIFNQLIEEALPKYLKDKEEAE